LIINSAGQDNHYSDPITNMNFSARGYAELTRLLKADIAVLEGGYSIEGALPYINTGIILAMAGLNYDHLREPDYDPKRYRQSADITRNIQTTCTKVLQTWHQRAAVTEALRARPGCDKRSRKIFYDTDQIYEVQAESVRICDDCGGALRIESSSDRSISILAVHLPRKACPDCRKQAYDWYEAGNTKQFDHIFLQDNMEDLYLTKKKGSPA
jgi:hypothetical protein